MMTAPRTTQKLLAALSTIALVLPAARQVTVTLFSDSFDRADDTDIDNSIDGMVSSNGVSAPRLP